MGQKVCGAVAEACLWIAALFAAGAQAACDAPKLNLDLGMTFVETRPLIAWQPVTGASNYRVRVQNRVANGKVLASLDTVVNSAAFTPPQPLAEHRAKVQVRVSAICGKETSAEAVAAFDIDATPNCRLGTVDARRNGPSVEMRWEPVAGASVYDVRAAALVDGKLIASTETRAANARLDVKGGTVVSVQPRCAAGLGEAVYRVLAPD